MTVVDSWVSEFSVFAGDLRTAALFRIRESRKREWRSPWNIRKEVRDA